MLPYCPCCSQKRGCKRIPKAETRPLQSSAKSGSPVNSKRPYHDTEGLHSLGDGTLVVEVSISIPPPTSPGIAHIPTRPCAWATLLRIALARPPDSKSTLTTCHSMGRPCFLQIPSPLRVWWKCRSWDRGPTSWGGSVCRYCGYGGARGSG